MKRLVCLLLTLALCLGCALAESKEYAIEKDVALREGLELHLTLHTQALDESQFGLSAIDVYRDGALLQTIEMSEAVQAEWGDAKENGGNAVSYAQDAELTLEDVNFDGTGDLSVLAWNTTGANLPRYYWLWNEEKQQFEYAFCLSNLEVDTENRQLVTSTRENAVTCLTEYYEYAEDGTIRLTRRVTDEYFPAE